MTTTGFLGKEGFAWFFGVVEDRMDPLEVGRVKIRVFGYHSSDKNELPTEALPWATVLQPTTSANFSGKGLSSVGLLEGTWVFGFFADTNSYQIPVVIGAISGLNAPALQELKENYGSAFKDNRTLQTLQNFPSDEIVRDYPNGDLVSGDRHGAQLKTQTKSSGYPTENYKAGANSKPQGTPDTNILALNDPTRITKTIVDLKTKERGEGGLLDVRIPVADVNIPPFYTGIFGGSKTPSGPFLKLPVLQSLGVLSSSYSSRKINSRQYKASPTNSNSQLIYTGTGPADIAKAAGSSVPSLKTVMNIGSSTMDRIKNAMNNITSLPSTMQQTVQSEASQTISTATGGTT